MDQNRFWELLAKKQAGEATPEEQTALNEYVLQNNIDKQSMAALSVYWDMPVASEDIPSDNAVHLKWKKLQQDINQKEEVGNVVAMNNKKKNFLYKFTIAASAITVLSLSIYWWVSKATIGEKPKENIVSTKNGSRSKVQLPDGTTVWLNAGSKILYNENYNKDERRVELTGEAYFDVVHNSDKPFVIHTKSMDVKVLGTVFNIRAYPSDKFAEASLIKGSIEVSFPGNKEKRIVLKPNEKISVLNKAYNKAINNSRFADDEDARDGESYADREPEVAVSELTYQPVDNSVAETAWVLQNKLVFRSKLFKDLSIDMERWFNVDMQFADEEMMDVKFTGTFSTETVTEALSALQLSYPFKYRYDKSLNLITFYAK